MRSSTIDWMNHGNMPINSVDVQPRGYRILTGGSDNKVCIWNLLPIISREYELKGKSAPTDIFDIDVSVNNQNCAKSRNEEAKSEMQVDQSPQIQQEHMDLSKNDRTNETSIEFDSDFQQDVEAMQGLFDKDETKSVRKLAELSNHEQPVNCVRWNNIGTFFASGGDDGRAILWEFKGHKYISKSQDIFENAYGGAGLPISQEDFKNQNNTKIDNNKIEIREDWQAKKIWRNHQSITDLTWAPDSIHFASCGTDSRICIMNINEGGPLQILDSKSNGLTFDPFGKFLASQSSEEKSVKIWRVQNFRNITLETEISSYYKQSMGMSINRRLSWSSDGSFISTTGGRVCGEYLVPLLERSSWKLMASLSGHRSSINISRINPRLYKTGGSKLDSYSIVAIVSQDSTISVWKPQLTKPFAVMMDFCMMGVTDLSWGFNGNILLSSSHDGKVAYFHFKPGTLGEPCSEFEKREIIKKRYGNQVLQDYIKNATTLSQQKSPLNQLSNANNTPQNQQVLNQEQKVTINAKTGKKKIVPKVERIFDDTGTKVNPHLNPFIQLNDVPQAAAVTDKANLDDNLKAPGQVQKEVAQKMKSDIKDVKTQPAPDAFQPAPLPNKKNSTQKQMETKLPSMSQIEKMQGTQTKNTQNTTAPVDKVLQGKPQDCSNVNQVVQVTNEQVAAVPQNQQAITNANDQEMHPQISKNRSVNTCSLQAAESQLPKQKIVPQIIQSSDQGKNATTSINKQLSGKELEPVKTTSVNSKVQPLVNQDFSKNKLQPNIMKIGQLNDKNVSQINNNNQGQVNLASVQLNSNSANELEFFHSVQQMFASSSIYTSIALDQYKSLFSNLLRDEIQIILPKDERDVFGEELKIAIESLQLNNYQQKINMKVYDEEAKELSSLDLNGERVVLVTGNKNFFILYTNKQLLHVFSSSTVKLIKRGLLIEGVCMVEQNSKLNKLVLLTFKGQLIVYDIIDSHESHINDEIKQVDIIDIVTVLQNQETQRNIQNKQARSEFNNNESNSIKFSKSKIERDDELFVQDIFVQAIKLYDTNEVELYLSNNERFIYQLKGLKQWRKQIAGPIEFQQQNSKQYEDNKIRIEPSLTAFENPMVSKVDDNQKQKMNNEENLSKLIDLLQKINEEEFEDLKGHEDVSHDQTLLDQQELVSMYENLGMKNEFQKCLHNYAVCVFQKLDLNRIKDLLLRFNLLEGMTKDGHFFINKEETLQSMLQNIDSQTCQNLAIEESFKNQIQQQSNPKKNRQKSGGLASQKTFCGMEKMQIFKKIILPVLKTIADGVQFDIIALIQEIVFQISQMDEFQKIQIANDKQNDQLQSQHSPQLNLEKQQRDLQKDSEMLGGGVVVPQLNQVHTTQKVEESILRNHFESSNKIDQRNISNSKQAMPTANQFDQPMQVQQQYALLENHQNSSIVQNMNHGQIYFNENQQIQENTGNNSTVDQYVKNTLNEQQILANLKMNGQLSGNNCFEGNATPASQQHHQTNGSYNQSPQKSSSHHHPHNLGNHLQNQNQLDQIIPENLTEQQQLQLLQQMNNKLQLEMANGDGMAAHRYQENTHEQQQFQNSNQQQHHVHHMNNSNNNVDSNTHFQQQQQSMQSESEQVQHLLDQLGIDMATLNDNPQLLQVLQSQLQQMSQQ